MANIDSKNRWNDTGIHLIANHRYRYEAMGRWKDWYIECDANGYLNSLMDLLRCIKRRPSARWFQLIGIIDKNTAYVIDLGTSGTFTAPVSGRLWAYANDAGFAYGNNSGSVELNVREDG
jgi:hypothetical protein